MYSGEVVGQPVSILNGEGSDAAAGRLLMSRLQDDGNEGYARCRNTTKSGVQVSHNVLIMRTDAGLLAISTNMKRDGVSAILQRNATAAQAAPPRPPARLVEDVVKEATIAAKRSAPLHHRAST